MRIFTGHTAAIIRAVKNVLEGEGFGLPKPIYRLRFNGRSQPKMISSMITARLNNTYFNSSANRFINAALRAN
ncbi:hypothetical protein [Sphingorhabdus sp. Alg239-R122]|uniref:hypothetical protein n=1 Tax=Sphingorhabdus sp. Alg239-R122 TaxID=2305989 RepID=UPI0013D9892F|nr:hypothetical protein [Sphingorhabdus sp. Alg239-R122]